MDINYKHHRAMLIEEVLYGDLHPTDTTQKSPRYPQYIQKNVLSGLVLKSLEHSNLNVGQEGLDWISEPIDD